MNRATLLGRVSVVEPMEGQSLSENDFKIKIIARDERGLSEWLEIEISRDLFAGLGSWRVKDPADLRGREILIDGRIVRKSRKVGEVHVETITIKALNIDLWEA